MPAFIPVGQLSENPFQFQCHVVAVRLFRFCKSGVRKRTAVKGQHSKVDRIPKRRCSVLSAIRVGQQLLGDSVAEYQPGYTQYSVWLALKRYPAFANNLEAIGIP